KDEVVRNVELRLALDRSERFRVVDGHWGEQWVSRNKRNHAGVGLKTNIPLNSCGFGKRRIMNGRDFCSQAAFRLRKSSPDKKTSDRAGLSQLHGANIPDLTVVPNDTRIAGLGTWSR